MKLIGLKDGNALASDENGAHQLLQFRVNEEVDVPEVFAAGAICAGYAKAADETEQSEADAA